MATLTLNEITERINIDNAKREKDPLIYAVKDTGAFIGGIARLAVLNLDPMIQDKLIDNAIDKIDRLKRLETAQASIV